MNFGHTWTARIGAMARHVVASEAPQDHSLLIPVNGPPYYAHQFQYSTNGRVIGSLKLRVDKFVQFITYGNPEPTPWHGSWKYCRSGEGIIVNFDYDGRERLANKKWVYLRGEWGIDYRMREIRAMPTAIWRTGPDGITPQQHVVRNMPAPLALTQGLRQQAAACPPSTAPMGHPAASSSDAQPSRASDAQASRALQ